MAQPAVYFKGTLKQDKQQFPVRVGFASRYSVWLYFDESPEERCSPQFDSLVLQVDDKHIVVGRCRLLDAEGNNGARLVPMESIHDFEKLFFQSRVNVLEASAVNLPLILGYKNGIDACFKEFVAELAYDLSVYKNMFGRMDDEYRGELSDVRETIQRGILDSLGPGLMEYLDVQLAEMARIVADFDSKQHEHHGYYLRRQLWDVIMCSPIMARTNLKPRGYIGDSEMMRMIYLNDYQGDSTFGKIMHKHPVGQPAAQAVRNRRVDVATRIKQFVLEAGPRESEKVKILSVACGPALELTEILGTAADCRTVHFSLLDQDQQALLEAASVIKQIENKVQTEISADFIRESVRTMLVSRELQARWGTFDFIYSMGLFDYLSPPVATAVLKKLYQLLNPGGELIIGNFHIQNPTMYYMAYWLDWSIFYRTEQDLVAIASELAGADTQITFDTTGIQMFLRVRKEYADGSSSVLREEG